MAQEKKNDSWQLLSEQWFKMIAPNFVELQSDCLSLQQMVSLGLSRNWLTGLTASLYSRYLQTPMEDR